MERDITSPSRSSGTTTRIKTASDWNSLFSIPPTLESTMSRYSSSRYSSTPSSTTDYYEPRRFSSATSATVSRYSDYGSSSLYSPSHFSTPRRPFTSRFLRSSHLATKSSDDEDDDNNNNGSSDTQENAGINSSQDSKTQSEKRPVRYQKVGAVLNGGTVIRIRREVSTSEESDPSTEEAEDEKEASPVASPSPTPEPEIPEDPLDKEERELNEQLMLSLTLTLVDEENIRQRLVEIKKSRLRNNQGTLGKNLVEKFVNDADVTLFECGLSPAKEEEEKNLLQKLATSSAAEEELSEVDQKDIQVRLQELLRDRKAVLETSLKNIESTYEHILQETSTEINELESSITNKTEMVQKLQDEILFMTVRKELLTKAVEQINQTHQDKVESLATKIAEIEAKISEYAIVKSSLNSITKEERHSKLSDIEPSDELREIERELECPVCMEIAQAPIYQCEEGHIICASCKPLLTNCPHNCGKKYSEPAIRCRFAEKLSEKYAVQLAKHFGLKNGSQKKK